MLVVVMGGLVAPGSAEAAFTLSMNPVSSDYHEGAASIPGPTVTVLEDGGAVSSDTVVSVTSSDAAVAVGGGGVTVPSGQTSADVQITCASQGSGTLTATLSTMSVTADVRCLAAGAPIMRASPLHARVATGKEFSFTAQVESVSGVTDPEYRVTVTGDNPTSFNETATGLNAGAVLAYTGQNAGVDEVKVCLGAACSTFFTIRVTWVTPQAQVTGSVAFGSQRVGTNSATQAVTVQNTGTIDLTIGTAAVAGTNSADFSTTSDSCSGLVVSPGASCTIAVRFSPGATGARTATLTVPMDAPAADNAVGLSGTGVEPAASLSVTAIGFGDQQTGTRAAGQAVTITNTGSMAMAVTLVTLGGTNASDFGITSNSCTPYPKLLAISGSCTVTVDFGPGAAGTRVATLSFSDDAPGSPHTVSLTGTGTIPPTGADPAPTGGDPAPAQDPPPSSEPAESAAGLTQPPAKLALLGRARNARSGGLRLRLRMPGAGRLVITARRGRRAVGAAAATSRGNAPLSILLRPGKAARADLTTRRRLPVKITAVFTPAAGGPAQRVAFRGSFFAVRRAR